MWDELMTRPPKLKGKGCNRQILLCPRFFLSYFLWLCLPPHGSTLFFHLKKLFFLRTNEKNKELHPIRNTATKRRFTPTTTTVPLMPEKNGVSYLT